MQWHLFFNSEGASPRAVLVGILAVSICAAGAGVLVGVLAWPKIVSAGLRLLLFYGGIWLLSRWFGRELRPIIVCGLAHIVQAGRRPAKPSDVE